MFDKNKFKACIVASGKNCTDVARYLGINEATLYRKIARDGDFSRQEITQLISFLKIQNPTDIFFAQ